ncbi:DNA polymerase III subunit alpha [Streptomyces erythrochromogenes]|uniref:DNA polymerase III subunit alpha n=1 Tax=Streptomyces erythrochromogenes TaxID=285574 RepID=UPI00342B684A
MPAFTHLHVASGYSLRYGAAHPAELVRQAADLGMGSLALTDRDNTLGLVRFAKASAKAGIRPIFGVDLAIAPYAPQAAASRRRTPVRGGAHVEEPPIRIVLLAQNRSGWARLCRLVSAAHANAAGGPPLLDWPTLRQHAGAGLTVLLGAVSEPGRALSAGRPDTAERLLAPWRDLGADLRLEAVLHDRPGTGPGSLRLAARTLELGDRLRVPTVLTTAARYAHPGQSPLADVLDAARLLRPIPPADRGIQDPGTRWLADPAQMATAAERIAECAGGDRRRAEQLLADTTTAGEECHLDPVADLGLGRPHLPEAHLVGAKDTADAARLLREHCESGLAWRGLDRRSAARQRMDEELDVITQLGYASYFLTVAQVVKDTRALGIRVNARGSGAGSMVNHLLGIAHAEPITHSLVFERFLSLRRTDLPDIDLDVESDRRLEVYDAIISRYGTDRAALTAMPETYRARHALRDTGMALGIAPQVIDKVAKAFPHIRARDITAALAELPELRPLAAEAADGRYGDLFNLAQGLDGLARGVAMHPCGVVISDATLLQRLPVQSTPGGYLMLHADKIDVEDLGLIKLDVLGVRMQSAMAHAVAEIARTTGRHIDLDDHKQVPPDDFFAFKLIQESDTLGCFQLESPGQLDLLARLQPRNILDVVADISLFRPGPVAADMPRLYVEARHGNPPPCPHPDLAPILADTSNVLIWHEQIIRIVATLTNCDLALAELARRALGDKERLPQVRDWFMTTARARGYDQTVLETVWENLAAFGAYGFCRAHATAFAVPALQSAWLKAHHPAAFYAGLFTHDPGMWALRILVQDAKKHGVDVLPVDINTSAADHRVEPAADGHFNVRLALSGVRGITSQEITRITAGQPYSSIQDFWQRARPSLPLAERLVSIGAADSLRGAASRRDLLLQITELHRHARQRSLADGQLPLDDGPALTADPTGLPEMTSREALAAELEILGVDLTHHLLDHHHQLLRELGATSARRLQTLHTGQQILVAGVRSATQTPPIRSGRRVIFTSLDDGSGLVDVAFFDSSHEACAHTVFHSNLLLVRGRVQRRGRRATVVAEMAWNLDELAAVRRDGGPEALQQLLGSAAPRTTTAPSTRRIQMETGAHLHPWADLQPAGTQAADFKIPAHSSPGSAG